MATITAIKERISQLNYAGFQILCDAYLSRKGYHNLVAFGTKAGTEKTTKGTPDTYFCEENGKYIFAEYTTQKTDIITKIKSDLKKCLNPEKTGIPLESLIEIVYCHTSSNISPSDDRDLNDLCSKLNVKLTLIGIDKLAEDLYVNYHSIVKDHLNLTIDTEQIQSYDDFLKQHDSNTLAAPLNTVFSCRDKELSQISEAFKNCDIVLLYGPAGVGKTRLALEYYKTRKYSSSEIFYCIHSRSLQINDDISMFFEKPEEYFVFIDDVNQLSQDKLIFELVNKRNFGYNVQIIASVRDYALQKVKDDLAGLAQYTSIAVEPITDEQVKSVVKDNFEINNIKYLDRIARIANGNCRIAIMSAKVSCDTNRLDSISDATDLYSEYYGKVLTESGLNTESCLLKTAGIMAFLSSIRLDRIDMLTPILAANGLDEDTFKENINKLHYNEIVDIYHDQAVVFSDQCLSNYVLKYVFFDKKVLCLSKMIRLCFSKYRSKTIYVVSTLSNVFRSDKLISYLKSEICLVWNQLIEEDSPDFMEYLKAFHTANQTETLIILNKMIDSMDCISIDPSKIDTENGKNYRCVNDDILEIIGGFADTDNLESALDLYFKYYLKRPDLYIKFFHTFSIFFSIKSQSFDCNLYTQKMFVKKITECSNNWTDKYICLLFFDISEELLNIEFSSIEKSTNGRTLNICHFYLPSIRAVFEYREALWAGLSKLAEKNDYLYAVSNILRQYGKGIDENNKEVIKNDSNYICQIMSLRYSPDDLESCLVAEHLQDVFSHADLQNNSLKLFTNSCKAQLYNILIGPKWDTEIKYDDYEERCRQSIIGFIKKSGDLRHTFNLLYRIYQESISIADCDRYHISRGIIIALEALSDNKSAYIDSAKLVVHSEKLEGINTLYITNNLFKVLKTSEVYAIISEAPDITSNIWEYSYFSELPSDDINQIELQKLYVFLQKDNDRFLQSGSFRDITFVNKFLAIDEDVLIKASKIVLSKQSYSPFIVKMYFNFLFNSYARQPVDTVNMFLRNISLLEEIYTYLEENNCNSDDNGVFLFEIFKRDRAYLSQFAVILVNKEKSYNVDHMRNKCQIFFNDDNYINIIDDIIQAAFDNNFAEIYMPEIIKQFIITSKDSEKNEKIKSWIKHYISEHCNETTPMICLFSALSQLNLDQLAKYLEIFISLNKSYEVFRKIPLIPTSCSWSGSAVPMYSLWISHLELLLPLFHGIDFAEHKKRVEDLIKHYRELIKEEEIEEVLNG